MITEDYVSFETARLLKEKGFDEGCSLVVNTTSKGIMPVSWPTTNSDIKDEKANLIAVPTLQMTMKWLREKHNIAIELTWEHSWFVNIIKMASDYESCEPFEYGSRSYEETCEVAINYCLENLI